MAQWCICCLISSSKEGGKIQTGLNCEYDGLSEVILTLSHSSTGTPPLTLFFETLKNRVSRKPCCQRSDLVLKPQNETASISKVYFFQQMFYTNSLIKEEIRPFLSSCIFIIYHIMLYSTFFIISKLVEIDKEQNQFRKCLQ